MEFLNTSNPVTLILTLILVLFLIIIAKISKKSFISGILLLIFLALLVMHIIELSKIQEIYSIDRTRVYNCIAADFTFILISFLSYLWVDNMEGKIKDKKEIKDGLDWFWEKI